MRFVDSTRLTIPSLFSYVDIHQLLFSDLVLNIKLYVLVCLPDNWSLKSSFNRTWLVIARIKRAVLDLGRRILDQDFLTIVADALSWILLRVSALFLTQSF